MRQFAILLLLVLAVPPLIGGYIALPSATFIHWRGGAMVRPHMAQVVLVLEGVALILLSAVFMLARRRWPNGDKSVVLAGAGGFPILLAILFATLRIAFTWSLIAPGPDWATHFSPYGKWQSARAFTIEIGRDGRYTLCDRSVCASERYHEAPHGLVLRNFQLLGPSQRLLKYRDITGPCNDRVCGVPSSQYDWHKDLYFRNDVGNREHRSHCGNRECLWIGQFYNIDGKFVKIEQHYSGRDRGLPPDEMDYSDFEDGGWRW